jgi:pyruvate/2-oxoglutarate dehydrogenase complex dihydrolipoamide acyltransferase (E2) component
MLNHPRDEPLAAVPADPAVAAPATESLGAPSPADPPAVKAASLSPRARRAAAEKAVAKKPAKTSARAGKGEKQGFVHKPKGPDLRADLRAFVQAQPGGWGHDDWIAFLDHLRGRGHDTVDEAAVGLALERERLAAALERIQGMGPRRVQAVVERYDTLYSACRADVDEIAALPGMNRSLAEKVRQALA